MLKPLLLSGWFRVQPFLNYVVVVMLIAPLIAASGHSTSAKQSKVVAKLAPESGESEAVSSETANVGEPDLAGMFQDASGNSLGGESGSGSSKIAAVGETPVLETPKIESLVVADYSIGNNHTSRDLTTVDPLEAVELAPIPDISINNLKLAAKFQAADIESLIQANNFSHPKTSRVASSASNRIPAIAPVPQQPEADSTTEAPSEEQAEQVDPIGSPHPIPWKWIVATQEAIGSKGNSGVRYYRSVPVISPDGKYAVYSRVQLEVKPEMYNSRVTSVMFVEDRQTKKLRVMATTAQTNDPLLSKQVSPPEQISESGQIGVLVPVSWSEKSDRFLARKFEGVFNTGDATDQAVIWDRQKNHTNTVAPTRHKDDHEKIAVLLGWSKNQPDHVLFRAGEMGEEEWPLVQVATDGKTVNPTDADQPVTFGDKRTEIWAEPQVATR